MLAWLLLLAWPGRGTAQAEPAGPEAAPPPATAAPARLHETYLALLGGLSRTSSSSVQATSKGILTPDVVVSRKVSYPGDPALALRLGVWINPNVGAALELGESSAKAEAVSLRFTTLSLVPMARLPLLRTAGEPEGLLRLHIGLMLTAVVEGDGSADFSEIGHKVSGSPRGLGGSCSGGGGCGPPSLGAALLVGASLHLGRVSLLLEQRASTLALTYTDYFQEVATIIHSYQAVLGVAVQL